MVEWIQTHPFQAVLISSLSFFLFVYGIMKLLERNKKDYSEELKEHWLSELEESKKLLEELLMKNTKSLYEMLHTEPAQEDYNQFVDGIIEKVKELHEEYQFQLLIPRPNDTLSGYAIRYQIFKGEDLDFYDKLFKFAIDRGLKEEGINKTIQEKAKAGEIVELGEGIEVEEEGTGMSSILQGGDLDVYISFTTEEYRKDKEATLTKREEEEAKYKEEQEKRLEQRKEAYEALTGASKLLQEATKREVEVHPEFEDILKKTQDIYTDAQ